MNIPSIETIFINLFRLLLKCIELESTHTTFEPIAELLFPYIHLLVT